MPLSWQLSLAHPSTECNTTNYDKGVKLGHRRCGQVSVKHALESHASSRATTAVV